MRQPKQRITAQGLDLKDQVISINRVTKVVKGGKNLSFAALVVGGDEGSRRLGYGKARECRWQSRGRRGCEETPDPGPANRKTLLPHQLIGRFGAVAS